MAFDYGNTLVMDPFEEVVDVIKAPVRDLLIRVQPKDAFYPYNEDEIKAAWLQANNKINFPYASHFHQEEPIIQAFLNDLHIPAVYSAIMAPQILNIYRQQLERKLKTDIKTSEEIRKAFEALVSKGKKIVVISNDRAFAPRSALSWLGVDDLVSEFITSEELGIEKPNPAVFEETAKRLNITLDKMVYVGDDPVRDIEAPKKIGMPAVLFVPPKKYRKAQSWRNYQQGLQVKPDTVIENLSDLIRIIV